MNCTKMFQNLNKFIYSKYIFIKTIKKFVPSFPLTVIISEKKKKILINLESTPEFIMHH